MESSSSAGNNMITTDDQTNAAKRRRQGEFVRGVSTARNWIKADKESQYPAEAGRYHLIVAYNCPWCHRVLLGRAVMGLQNAVSVDVCFPNRSPADTTPNDRGNLWMYCPEGQTGPNREFVKFDACTADTVLGGKRYVKELYEHAGIDDQTSVPVLWDKKTKTVVSNESAEILRMLGTVMRPFAQTSQIETLYPTDKQTEIDRINDFVYTDLANGCYKAGFSSSQEKYAEAYHKVFAALEKVDQILSKSKFLVGETVTEADLRLFPPMFRFDPVYYTRMKLNKHMLWHYRHIWRWMGDMMQLEGMDEVSNHEYLQHCKQGYFGRTGTNTIPPGPEGYPECYLEPHWTHKLLQDDEKEAKEQN